MKSQRRHELQQNVLDEELGKGIAFLKRWGFHLAMGVVVVVVLIWLGVTLYSNHKTEEMNRHTLLGQLLTKAKFDAESEKQLEELAEETDIVGALANYMQGRNALIQAMTSKAQKDDSDKKYRKTASEKFNKVIDDFGEFPKIQAKAHLGLARLAEEDGKIDLAISEYKKVIEIPEVKGHPIYEMAGERKSQLEKKDESNQEIRWAQDLTPRMTIRNKASEVLNMAAKTQGINADPMLLTFTDEANPIRNVVVAQIKAVRPLLKDMYGQPARIEIIGSHVAAGKAMVITKEFRSGDPDVSSGSIIVKLKHNSAQLWFVSEVDVQSIGNAKKILAKFMKR